jgi:exopolyphosphatase/guanosine-5'-triphosphate,3'-diphosphate pyrophosphatase
MIKAGTVDNLNHISEQRRPVFPGGFIILSTIFEELSIERMDTSEGALREGVAYDLIGRLHDEDSRFLGVDTLAALFNADPQQSKRVCQLAMLFLAQVQYKWKLSDEIDRKLLMWASSLHEIGISIAYSQHHSHGAYIIENSNMDGFSRQVQRVLALLVRNHRQKIDIEQVKWLPKKWPTKVIRLTIILRLAVAFVRGRLDMDLSGVQLFVDKENVTIRLAKDWAEKHPLTLFDLETEQAYLDSVGYKLEVELN